MADIAFGSVEKIVKIALKIKEAVETVKQNQKECHDIEMCVTRVSALLKKLDETTDTMRDEVMRDALEDLAKSLQCALDLVTECQRKHILRRFLGARDMAKELDRVQNDIVRKLQLGNFATSVQATVMLTSIQSTSTPQLPPRRGVSIDGFTMFSSSELKTATKDFSDANIIARGEAAIIWKGKLYDGQVVAIKKVSDMFLYENQDSLYEKINIFIELKHQNVARPLGYSHEIIMELHSLNGKYIGAEQRQFFFVEEYMPGGSMADAIKEGSLPVDWCSRLKIIQGIAQGLHYLHEQRVVHLDLKPANILLDSNMHARIGDFGVAKKLDHADEVTCDIDYIVGTPGFMAPEYLSKGILSTKCDVYAFGTTILQIISTMCISRHPGIGDSVEWAWKAREDLRMEFFDISLCDNSQLIQIKRCIEIGLLCIDFDKICRPTMAEVLAMLNGDTKLPPPKQPYGIVGSCDTCIV